MRADGGWRNSPANSRHWCGVGNQSSVSQTRRDMWASAASLNPCNMLRYTAKRILPAASSMFFDGSVEARNARCFVACSGVAGIGISVGRFSAHARSARHSSALSGSEAIGRVPDGVEEPILLPIGTTLLSARSQTVLP